MLGEKPNDSFNWKNRLEELDGLQGEKFSRKTELWEELHMRLRTNKRRRKAAWYWMAAVCLGVILMLIPWSKNKNEPVLVKVNPIINNSKTPGANTSSVMIKKERREISTGSRQTKPVTINKVKHPPDHPGKKISIENNIPGLALAVSSPEPLPALPVDTGAAVTVNRTPVVAKKKLRVVHINELGTPVEEDAREERYAERPSYNKKLTSSNQDALSNTFSNSHPFGNDLFKTKISP